MEIFTKCANAGNVAGTAKALDELANAGEKPSLFLSLLLHVISQGRHELFDLFLTARGNFRGLTVADCRTKPFLFYAAGGCSNAAMAGGVLNAKNSAIIVKKLLNLGLNSEDCSADNCRAIVCAILRGYTETVRLLLEKMPPSYVADEKILTAISFSKAGAEILDIVQARTWTRTDYENAFYNVVLQGNVEVLDKFIKLFADSPEELRNIVSDSQAFLIAVRCGHLSMVKKLAVLLDADYCRSDNYKVIEFIGRTGSFVMLQIVDEIWGLTPHDYMATSVPLQMAMMCRRNTDMLEWLLHKGLRAPDHFMSRDVLQIAILHQNTLVLDWLWSHGVPLHAFEAYPYLIFAMRGISRKTVSWDWLFAHGLRQDANYLLITKWLLGESLRNNALDIVKWLWERGHITQRTFADHHYDFMRVVVASNDELRSYLRERLPQEFFVYDNCALFRKAINFGNDDIVEWLMGSGFNINVVEADTAASADAAVLDQLIQLGARPRDTDLGPWQKNAKNTIRIALLCEIRLGKKLLPSEVWLYMTEIW